MFQKPDYQSQMSRPAPDICQTPDVEDGGGYLLPNSKSGHYTFFLFPFVKKSIHFRLGQIEDDFSKGRIMFSSAPCSNFKTLQEGLFCADQVSSKGPPCRLLSCDTKWFSDKTYLTAARPKQQELEGVTTTYPSPAPLISRKRPWTTADI